MWVPEISTFKSNTPRLYVFSHRLLSLLLQPAVYVSNSPPATLKRQNISNNIHTKLSHLIKSIPGAEITGEYRVYKMIVQPLACPQLLRLMAGLDESERPGILSCPKSLRHFFHQHFLYDCDRSGRVPRLAVTPAALKVIYAFYCLEKNNKIKGEGSNQLGSRLLLPAFNAPKFNWQTAVTGDSGPG